MLLAGKSPDFVNSSLFGASLCAFSKEDGSVRPIAVGSVFRQLPARIAASYATNKLSTELSPHQVGVGVKGGCEAAVYATHILVQEKYTRTNQNDILVKVNVLNSFNSQ